MRDLQQASHELNPGQIVHHKDTGSSVTLSHRKNDGSGWWCTDGSGLADYVLDSDSWGSTAWSVSSPSCGCWGTDTSATNPDRLCQPCGLRHATRCGDLTTKENL